MAKPDPKKLAAAILKARGTKTYDALIASTFEALAKEPEIAWKVLELADERACRARAKKKGSTWFEREVRQLGTVVAWRDSQTLMSRDVKKPGAMNLEINASRRGADARAEDLADDKRAEWGVRPGADEPQDAKAHKAERARIFEAGDVAKLKAYRKRYDGAFLLSTHDLDGHPRQSGMRVIEPGSLLWEAITAADDPKMLKLLLADEHESWAIEHALENAIRAKRPKAFATLLPKLEKGKGAPILALAVNEKAKEIALALLKAGADPNHSESDSEGKDGNGAMVNAVRNADEAMLKLLLANGGNPSGKTNANRSLQDFAKERKNKKVLALLTAAQEKMPMDMDTAIINGDVARVLELLPENGTSWPLIQSAQTGNVAVLRAVLESKVAKAPEDLSRALHTGIQGGEEVVALLLKHGADPNLHADRIFGSVLAFAQKTNRTKIVTMLKAAGAKLRIEKKK